MSNRLFVDVHNRAFCPAHYCKPKAAPKKVKANFNGALAHRRVKSSNLSSALSGAEIAMQLRNIIVVVRCDRESATNVIKHFGRGVECPEIS